MEARPSLRRRPPAHTLNHPMDLRLRLAPLRTVNPRRATGARLPRLPPTPPTERQDRNIHPSHHMYRASLMFLDLVFLPVDFFSLP